MIGHGNQGKKHSQALGNSCVGVVDESSLKAGINALNSISDDSYNAVVIATPEFVKNEYITYALSKNKHVLVEKPIELDSELQILIQDSLTAGISFETAYDHQFDSGVRSFIEKVKQIPEEELIWSSLRINYSFGTESLIIESPWMDFGTGPWELVAPHALRILCELDDGEANEFEFSFGIANLESPSTVTAVRSGKKYTEITTSYTSWLNTFSLSFTWNEGTIELNGLTKWGESSLTQYKRVHPAGKPEIIETVKFESRSPVQAVATLHQQVFSRDLNYSLSCDLRIADFLKFARRELLTRNYSS